MITSIAKEKNKMGGNQIKKNYIHGNFYIKIKNNNNNKEKRETTIDYINKIAGQSQRVKR